jgi:hypothetical protein
MPKKTQSKFEKIQKQAWAYYQKWSLKGSFSPALNEKILVSRFGWNHLVDPRKRRTKVQKIKRFLALPLAKKLIETATTYQEHRFDHGINYYAFIAEMEGKRIKVVISSKNNKQKVFLSVIVLR